jgi:hypothetical protein
MGGLIKVFLAVAACVHVFLATWVLPGGHSWSLLAASAVAVQVLGELVDKSGYSPQAAAELHKQLYRQKVQQLVAKKKLTSEDNAELARIRRILCIPPDVANQVLCRTVLSFCAFAWVVVGVLLAAPG